MLINRLLLITALGFFTACEGSGKPSNMPEARRAIDEALVAEFTEEELVRIASAPDKHRALFIKTLTKRGVDGLLTRERAITLRQVEQTMRRADEVRKILIHDYDANGQISQEDFALIPEAGKNRQVVALRVFMESADNPDGVLSYKQVIALADERASRSMARNGALRRPEVLLIFDMNEDDVVNATEIIEGVKSISAKYRPNFDTAANGQGVSNCALPPVSAEDEIILLGAYGSGSLSSATIGSDDTEVQVMRVEIEDGQTPLYIAAASYEAMIWQFDGATERVSSFSVKSSSSSGGAVGVTGLEKKRVIFLDPAGCLKRFSDVKKVDALESKAEMIAELGRGPDHTISTKNALSILLPSGRRVTGKHDRKDIDKMRPDAVDRETWRDFMRFNRGGVIEIDPKTVIATHPVKPYSVLPQQAGLVQLLKAGKLKRLGIVRGAPYLLLKPIGRYPTGLAGAHSVNFIVPKGVPFPQGSLGHSSVYFEATGECTGHGDFCRKVAASMFRNEMTSLK